MSAKILDGKAIAQKLREELRDRIAKLKKQKIVPGLGVLLVGNDPASRSYVTAKERACKETGLYSREIKLPATATRREILNVVKILNEDDEIDGILVQLPLPDSSMEQSVIEMIDPSKDVDGFHPLNVGRMMLGMPAFLPCTPHGILQILKRSNIPIQGAHAVVIGRSHIVGRPLVNLLSQKRALGNATVTMCHTRTKNMENLTRQADIVIAAVGRPNVVTADMIKEGAVVIDVGVNRVEDVTKKRGYRLCGDVDFDAVSKKASAITPVPGGVGPMTITMLLANTVDSAMRRHGAE